MSHVPLCCANKELVVSYAFIERLHSKYMYSYHKPVNHRIHYNALYIASTSSEWWAINLCQTMSDHIRKWCDTLSDHFPEVIFVSAW